MITPNDQRKMEEKASVNDGDKKKDDTEALVLLRGGEHKDNENSEGIGLE